METSIKWLKFLNLLILISTILSSFAFFNKSFFNSLKIITSNFLKNLYLN